MLHRIMSIVVAAIGLAACTTAAPPKPEANLAVRCELAKCECRDIANPFSTPSPPIWNEDGTAGCAEGRRLVALKEKAPIGLALPDFDDPADLDKAANPYRRWGRP